MGLRAKVSTVVSLALPEFSQKTQHASQKHVKLLRPSTGNAQVPKTALLKGATSDQPFKQSRALIMSSISLEISMCTEMFTQEVEAHFSFTKWTC